jgi:hypothetical protein
MRCHRCGVAAGADPVGRREVCAGCGAWLHCCRNCDFFAPGAHHDCREPVAEVVVVKEDANFCDWFRPRPDDGAQRASDPAVEARARLERLFRKP